MASLNGWGCLPSDVIDSIVDVLKRRRSWKRDGRSLKLVNKHWRLSLNRNITSISSKASAAIHPTNVVALQVFPRLSSLDISTFVLGIQKYELTELLTSLRTLPRLRTLSLSPKAIDQLDGESLDQLVELGVKVLPVGLCRSSHLQKMKNLHIEELFCCFRDIWDLLNVQSSIPSLRHLRGYFTYFIEIKPPIDLLRQLGSLESLELKIDRLECSIGFLTTLRNLTAVDLSECREADLKVLLELPRLVRLSAAIDSNIPANVVFAQVVRQLSTLKLRSFLACTQPLESFPEASNLQSLTLSDVRFGEMPVLSKLPGLSSFCWIGFSFRHGISEIACLKSLKKLCIVRPKAYQMWHPDCLPLNHEALPHLRSLTIEAKGKVDRWLVLIGGLTRLETLCFLIQGPERVFPDQIRPITHLTHLEALGIAGTMDWMPKDWSKEATLWNSLNDLVLDVGPRVHPMIPKDLISIAPHTNIQLHSFFRGISYIPHSLLN